MAVSAAFQQDRAGRPRWKRRRASSTASKFLPRAASSAVRRRAFRPGAVLRRGVRARSAAVCLGLPVASRRCACKRATTKGKSQAACATCSVLFNFRGFERNDWCAASSTHPPGAASWRSRMKRARGPARAGGCVRCCKPRGPRGPMGRLKRKAAGRLSAVRDVCGRTPAYAQPLSLHRRSERHANGKPATFWARRKSLPERGKSAIGIQHPVRGGAMRSSCVTPPAAVATPIAAPAVHLARPATAQIAGRSSAVPLPARRRGSHSPLVAHHAARAPRPFHHLARSSAGVSAWPDVAPRIPAGRALGAARPPQVTGVAT